MEDHPKQDAIKPQAEISFDKYEVAGWKFLHSDKPMFSARELDQISDQTGTMGMPEVVYGSNRLYLVKPDRDLLIEFAPIEALRLTAFEKQKKMFIEKTSTDLVEKMEDLKLEEDEDERHLNYIDMIAKQIEVKDAVIWKKKDMSKVKDFKQIEIISDWTYSTTYKGNVRYLSKHAPRIQRETSLGLPVDKDSAEKQAGKLKVEKTEEEIPYSRLGKENPIVHYGQVFLYEDDLGDQGNTMCTVRFRVMSDCFYILLRYYLRVDGVIVRIFDTRWFHSFDNDYILREFQHKENTYDELKAKDFKLTSEWSLSNTQSDEVFPHLDLKLKVLDKVSF